MKNTYTLRLLHPANPHDMSLIYIKADMVRTSEGSFLFFKGTGRATPAELVCAYPTCYTIIEKVEKNEKDNS